MDSIQVGTSGFPAPQVDITRAGDPLVQQLLRENYALRTELDRLLAINARLERKLTIARDGIQVLADRIKHVSEVK